MIPQFRILIADDEPVLTKLLGKMLDVEGYATELVNQSTDVLERMRQFKPQAVILDIAMPVVDGHKIAKLIRAEPGFENVLLVAVSGYADSHVKQSMEAGINHHLVKPIDFKQLLRILDNELDGRAVIAERIAEINALIDRIVESPQDRIPGEYAALIQERAALEKKLSQR
ncbi:MAG TPA: response regulator [Pirellulales bacterium]|jgi:CheY-like chemotaxis protein|nr:response regulator [Pirellulales bacterium]